MTLSELQEQFETTLESLYPNEEIQTFFAWLTEAFLGWNRFEASLHKRDIITASEIERFETALNRLKKFEPIQYILGETEWFGLTFQVNKHTLIPRPETEELLRWIIETSSEAPKNILDIGTGSGCIATALALQWPKAKVTAIDISSEALHVAKNNAEYHRVSVSFSEIDILKQASLPEQYDLIISNPPYVRRSEQEKMQPNVLHYEPTSALYVEDVDPFLFYRKIAQLSKHHLTPSGKLYFEINEYLGKELQAVLKNIGFKEVILKKDVFQKHRMICCSL
ncbi:MAG: protein-(glutamine-N5) methyltransferase, release factor-specific [Flavobacteriaceae bacterium]|nr:protein-(glutamine-N5) methyltransferase, release factor-specific [Flavobacteriaceae bacterium]